MIGMTLHKDLREFIESLNSANVRYVIVGGYAVAYHGHPRATGDIDFFVEASADNASRIVEAIREFGFGDIGLTAEDFSKPDAIIQLGRPPRRIDIITSVDAVSFEEAWTARVPANLDGIPVHFIDRELLLRNKRSTGRVQDQADAEKLQGTEN